MRGFTSAIPYRKHINPSYGGQGVVKVYLDRKKNHCHDLMGAGDKKEKVLLPWTTIQSACVSEKTGARLKSGLQLGKSWTLTRVCHEH